MSNLLKYHPKIAKLIKQEARRQKDGLELIPSENYVSQAVLEAMGSVLTNKYSEGYPQKRYYGGNEYVDEIEMIAIKRAKKLFRVTHANVQPYSGSPANLALTMAVCQPGDTIMGLNLTDGGHLTHGWKVSATGIFFNSVSYHVKATGRLDYDEIEALALKHKPKLIWAGATAYMFQFDFKRFADIADKVDAYLAVDIAHIAGLIAGGVHRSPANYAHLISTTTHKTLRGPRGGIIMVTKKGMKKDPELANKIDRAVFPGLQGGPHDHTTAAIAISLKQAAEPAFAEYAKQIVKNAKILAVELSKHGFSLVGNTTENHLVLVDLTPFVGAGGGYLAQFALDLAGITLNKNTIPQEPFSPFYPSGIRLGTPALTTRGMQGPEMKKVALWIKKVLDQIKNYRMPKDKKIRLKYLSDFRDEIATNIHIKKIKSEIKQFSQEYPINAWED
jgi:glycine hydroxymethyltransferase